MTRTPAETIALSVLARNGIEAIWELEVAAAETHARGRETAAAIITEIAEAAEREWFRLATSPESVWRSIGST
jgi:hypothetical protein